MKLSQSFVPTLKEIPSDAVNISHKLMLRAGLIRSLGAGIYSYLPLFTKTIQKVMTIIREEMNAAGAQEFLLPALNPVELWEESGRQADFGNEKFNFKDRKGHEMTLAPTHEEIICDIARNEIRSYKDLPQVWYQIQTKFRDEPRPRSGVLRTRQFIMKDAYSLDSSWEGLDKSYEDQKSAYKKIFTRCGLDFFIVGASSGLMGGRASQEFMVESPGGEDTCALCDTCGYAANIEVAGSRMRYRYEKGGKECSEVHTPDQKTIDEVSEFLNRKPEQFIKALLYIAGEKPVMILLNGQDELSETKLGAMLGVPVRPAHPEEVFEYTGVKAGFIGPVGLKKGVTLYIDDTLKGAKGMVCGANKNDYHLIDVDLEKHSVKPEKYADLRTVKDGDPCPQCGKPMKIVRAIEMGHIFKLGTKYSDSMGAVFQDAEGKSHPIIMGSYGIGIERIVAAHIEQWADENGIVWRGEIAPHKVVILPLKEDDDIASASEKLYNQLTDAGFEPVLDDRNIRAGVKFKDADLMGFPVQIVFGKLFTKGKAEMKNRRTGERIECYIDSIEDELKKMLKE